ncbi:MAG: hypothetical protein DRQ06_01060 [Candidatus Hydrothermota bacterium]|nr:MAG: hypothetical protein DRQ06_01060 [Candidatus Hydrothermae bacterium]
MLPYFLVLIVNIGATLSVGVTGWAYTSDTVRSLARPLGIQWTYIDANWDFIGRSEGKYDFRQLGRELERAKSFGYKVIVGVKGTPVWASSVPIDSNEISPDSIWDVWDSLTYEVLLRKLNFQDWPPSRELWGKFVEEVVRFAELYFDGDDILVNVWNEPDGTRIGVVHSFYRMFVDTSKFLLGQVPTGDSLLFLLKLSDSHIDHPETLALVKRYFKFEGKLYDIDVCTLTVSHRLLNFVRETLWTPENYAREIFYPAYKSAKRVDEKVKIVPAAPMYATFVNFRDRLPPDSDWQDLHWDAGSLPQLIDWVERFWNAKVKGKYMREYADGITHHFYVPNRGHLVSPREVLPAVLDSLEKVYDELGILGKKPFYVTEFGFATWPHRHPESDPVYDSQAVYYSDFLDIFYGYRDRLNIELVEAYRWCDNPRVNDYFGIIFMGDTLTYEYYKKNPVPKPCYYILKEFTQVCAGRSFFVSDSAATSGANGKKITKLNEKVISVFPYDQGLLCLLNGEMETLRVKSDPFLRNPAIASDDRGCIYIAFSGDSGLYVAKRELEGQWDRPRLLFKPGTYSRVSFPAVVCGGDGVLHISFLIDGRKFSNKIVYGAILPTAKGFRVMKSFESVTSVRGECEPFLGLIGDAPVIVWKEKNRAFAFMEEKGSWIKLWDMPADNGVEGFGVFFDPSGKIHVAWSDQLGLYHRVYSLDDMRFGKVEKVASMKEIKDIYLIDCNGRLCIIFSRRVKSLNSFLEEEVNLYLAMKGDKGEKWTFRELRDGSLNSRFPQCVLSGNCLYYLWTETGYRFNSVKRDSTEVYIK